MGSRNVQKQCKYKQFSKFPGMIFKNYLNEINNITFTLLYDFKIHVASYQNFSGKCYFHLSWTNIWR